ncbi:hypothetical protein ACLMJK_001517 [Lecanora helva]
MTSKPGGSRGAISNTGNVRRNLFHHQLSRRPTSASTSTSGTTLLDSVQDDGSDIVVRDRNGKYDVQIPDLQPLVDDTHGHQQEEEAANDRDKIDTLLLERYKDRSLQPGELGELLAAVQASLRRKAASLDEDKWIFEADQEKPAG